MDRKMAKRLNREHKRLRKAAQKGNANKVRTMQRHLKDARREALKEETA